MKALHSGKGARPTAVPGSEHVEAARRALEAIKQDSERPENYTALASALRMLAQPARERDPEAADNLLLLACAAAWEARRRSTPALISGRTKQEVKTLTAWLRMKNHLTPEAAEGQMEEIRTKRLADSLDSSNATLPRSRPEVI
jgi:hypothetical protein